MSLLGDEFADMRRTFTFTATAPVSVILRRRWVDDEGRVVTKTISREAMEAGEVMADGVSGLTSVWAVDRLQGARERTTVLSDLGQAMERMLTMEPTTSNQRSSSNQQPIQLYHPSPRRPIHSLRPFNNTPTSPPAPRSSAPNSTATTHPSPPRPPSIRHKDTRHPRHSLQPQPVRRAAGLPHYEAEWAVQLVRARVL